MQEIQEVQKIQEVRQPNKDNPGITPNYGNIAIGMVLGYITFKSTPRLIELSQETYKAIKEKAPHMTTMQKIIAGVLGTGVIIPWLTIGFVVYMNTISVKKSAEPESGQIQ